MSKLGTVLYAALILVAFAPLETSAQIRRTDEDYTFKLSLRDVQAGNINANEELKRRCVELNPKGLTVLNNDLSIVSDIRKKKQ